MTCARVKCVDCDRVNFLKLYFLIYLSHYQLLNDLEQKRAELAMQRCLLDDKNLGQSRHNQQQQLLLGQEPPQLQPSSALIETKEKLREAVSWAEAAEAKLNSHETYWRDQHAQWVRERADLQDRVHEIVQDRVRRPPHMYT